MQRILGLIVCAFLNMAAGAIYAGDERADGAIRLPIELTGSLQNPVFSPNSAWVLFTRFRDGYNLGPADLFVYHLPTGALRPLVSDGSVNVSLPGSSWNSETDMITFSSDRGAHDEIYMISSNAAPGEEMRVTDRAALQSFEPSFSPDGRWVVFESHVIDDDLGVITKHRLGSDEYVDLTVTPSLIKQPNWSPTGDAILYQSLGRSEWAIHVMDVNGGTLRRVTRSGISATHAVFSQDGKTVYFSGESEDRKFANIFSIGIEGEGLRQITHYDGYDGAVSVSHDGGRIVFEGTMADPDTSHGTALWLLDLP